MASLRRAYSLRFADHTVMVTSCATYFYRDSTTHVALGMRISLNLLKYIEKVTLLLKQWCVLWRSKLIHVHYNVVVSSYQLNVCLFG